MKKNFKSKIALFVTSMTLCMCTMQGAFANSLHDAVKSGNFAQVVEKSHENPSWIEEKSSMPKGRQFLIDHCTDAAKIDLLFGKNVQITPLQFATYCGNIEMVNFMINYGASRIERF